MKGKTKELRMTYWVLITAFLLLMVIGTVNVFSSTFVDDRAAGNVFSHLIRQAIIFGIGIIPSIFVYKHDYEFWHRHTQTIVVITIVLLLAVLTVGVVVNGARRWIGLAGLTFQPSELAKLTSILYVATILTPLLTKHKRIDFLHPMSRSKHASFWQRIAWIPHRALVVPIIMALLVFKQPDAGTAVVILVIPVLMLAISGASLKKMKIPILLIILAVSVVMMAEPYRRDRITAWMDPWAYEKTLGYQTVQSLIAIGSGGFMGQGLGEGISKFSYLPEAHTDFAFAVLAQEWGMRGTVTMLVLFCLIIYFGAVTAWSCRSRFGMLLALGVTLYFGGQGFINIGMVSGILPVVGVPLPFISYGGTSLIVNMVAAALLLNISKRNYKEAERSAIIGTAPPLHSMKQETRSEFPLK